MTEDTIMSKDERVSVFSDIASSSADATKDGILKALDSMAAGIEEMRDDVEEMRDFIDSANEIKGMIDGILAAAKPLYEARVRKLAEETGIVRSAKAVRTKAGTKAKAKAKAKRRPMAKPVPKYAHPDDQSLTWAGTGRKPDWLNKELKSGRQLEEFAIS